MTSVIANPKQWIDTLNNLARKSSELISARGWIQDQMTGEEGELCIIAAAHEAAIENNTAGLSHVLREVLDYLEHAEIWNDTKGRRDWEVMEYLDRVTVTEAVLEGTFGPLWTHVCYLCEMFGRMDSRGIANWLSSKDEVADYLLLKELDRESSEDPRELRARSAICAAASEKACEFGLRPNGPSAALMALSVIRPSLTS